MTSRTGRSTRDSATRREQLTAIAAALFARDGYHNVTVGDIASAAGLSGPAIYRHFPGKQALLAEVVRSGFDEMARAVAADLAHAPADPAQRLRTTYRDLAAFVIRHPEFGVMWRREYRHLAPEDAAELAQRMGEASRAAVVEIVRLRPELDAGDAELVSWAALSVLGSISDHRVRLPRAAFEELLAGIAMGVVSAGFDASATDNRPQVNNPTDRKEQILAAAARLFWDRGYHAVTLEEIGAAAGIAGPSIYSHFAGKTDLLRTITERIGERLRLTLAEPLGAESADLLATAAAERVADESGLDCVPTDRIADSAASTVVNADRSSSAGPESGRASAAVAAHADAESGLDRPSASVAAEPSASADPNVGRPSIPVDQPLVTERDPSRPAAATPDHLTPAESALAALATRYVTTVLDSRDLVAAYFTEGHNLPDRDRAETRRFQRAYAAHWASRLAAARPEQSSEEVRIRVLAAFAVVNDTARTRRFADRAGLAGRLRALMLAVLLTPGSGVREVNRG